MLCVMLGSLLASAGGHGLVSDTLGLFVGLLSVAATIGILTKFVRIPYTVALVVAEDPAEHA